MLILMLCAITLHAQPSRMTVASQAIQQKNNSTFIKLNSPVKLDRSQAADWILTNVLKAKHGYSLQFEQERKDKQGFTHLRFKEFFNDIPVDDAVYIAHLRNGFLESVNGTFYDSISVNTVPTISKASAFQNAVVHFNATQFINDSINNLDKSKEEGQLIIIKEKENFRLTYKFDLFAVQPFKRSYVFVDAENGKVIADENRISNFSATGTAVTAYNGIQTFTTDSVSPTQFVLRDSTRGNGIITLKGSRPYHIQGIDITNTTDYWNSYSDERFAYDAHYGAQVTYDFLLNNFGRNSYDGNGAVIRNYVMVADIYNGAMWYENGFAFGKGDMINYYTFTSLDVVGHEIAHAMVGNIPTVLSESIADMFGATIRFIYNPAKATWILGDQEVIPTGTGKPRLNMANPKAFLQPDTYLGQYWTGSNQSVPDYWYYLLSTGGNGVNDLGNAYNVNGLGLNNAIAIVYRMMDAYLTPTSDLYDARLFSIIAASDLFGNCSNEAQQVANAWYAVGVGDTIIDPAKASFFAVDSFFCSTPATVSFVNTSYNATSYNWDFGDGTFSIDTSPVHTYNNTGNYTVKLVATGTGFCSGNDSISIVNCVSVNNLQLPLAPSCIPTSNNSNYLNAISRFQFGGIDNSSTSRSIAYEDFTCLPVQYFIAGDPVQTKVTNSGGTVAIFIDYDNSGTFDSIAELAFYDNQLHTGSVNLPTNVTLNTPLRLRVLSNNGYKQSFNGCDSLNYGQAEDYSVTIVATTQKPVANFSANKTTINQGESVAFKDSSIKCPTGWYWIFDGGIPSISTDRNPVIYYADTGKFKVTLIASNSYGADTIIKTAYINVSNTFKMCKGPDHTNYLTGKLYDSGGPSGDYSQYEYCQFLIDPGCVSNITLNLISLNIYSNAHFKVYDGATTNAPLIMHLTSDINTQLWVTAYSGTMLITWTANESSSTDVGFFAQWTSQKNVTGVPTAAFAISDTIAPLNGAVYFTDQSLNNPANWKWDFGDGTNSFDQNPVHYYTSPGNFDVTLITGNCNSFDTVSHQLTVVGGAAYANNTDSLKVTLNCGDSIVVPIIIKNTGTGDLFYHTDSSNVETYKKVTIFYGSYTYYMSVALMLKSAIKNLLPNCQIDTVSTYSSLNIKAQIEQSDVLMVIDGYYYNYNQINPFLPAFFAKGGTVIMTNNVDPFTTGFSPPLFAGNEIGQVSYPITLTVTDTTDILSKGIPPQYISSYSFLQNITNADKKQLATYNGNDVVTYRNINNGTALYIGSFFSTNLAPDASTVLLMANAIKNSTSAYIVPFVNINPKSGNIEPGDSAIVNVTFNSSGYSNGIYTGYVLIYTNDILNPVDSLPVSMTVAGNAALSLSDTCLHFGSIFQHAIDEKKLTIENTGCDTLHITAVNSSDPSFTVSPSVFDVPPFQSEQITVSFSSPAINNFNATLTLINNVHDTTVCLNAQTIASPQISLSTNSISVNLSCHDSVTVPFYIHSNNGDTLNYNISGCSNSDPVNVLALVYKVDTGLFHNLINGINNSFTNYILDTTSATNPAEIHNLLLSHDVLLIPPLNYGFPKDSAFIDVLQHFLSNGGDIILTKQSGYFPFNYGLFSLVSYSYSSNIVECIDTANILVKGIPKAFYYNQSLYGYQFGESNVIPLLTVYNKSVAAYREINKGRAFYLGVNFNIADSIFFTRVAAHAIEQSKLNMPSWMNVLPDSGNVLTGDSSLVYVTISSANLSSGNYNGYVLVNSNDPLKPVDSITVSMNVSGSAEMVFSDSCFNFGTVLQYGTKTDSTFIYNNGCDSIVINNVSVNNNAYTLLSFDSVIAPYGASKFKVRFNSPVAGNFNSTISVFNNVHDTTICLSAFCKATPIISISPDTISASLSCHDSVFIPFMVHNSGGDSLWYQLEDTTYHVLMALSNGSYNPYYYSLGITSTFHATFDTTYATTPADLENRLKGKDVFIIDNRWNYDTTMTDAYSNCIKNFALRGGTVCVFQSMFPNSLNRMYDLKLFSGKFVAGYTTVSQLDSINTNDSLWNGLNFLQGSNEPIYVHDIQDADKVRIVGYKGMDVITYKNTGRGKIIYFGFDDINNNNYQLRKIFLNAVKYSRFTVLPSFISVPDQSNFLGASGSSIIMAKFNANGFPSGDYITTFHYNTNDPFAPVDSIVASLHISGGAEISLSKPCLDFQNVPQYISDFDTLIISNSGCDTLMIDSISSNNNDYKFSINATVIPPYSNAYICATFQTQAVGSITGTLSIYTNINDTSVCLNAISDAAPVASVNPDSIVVNLSCNDSVEVPIIISNSGVSTLQYHFAGSGNDDTLNVLAVMTYAYSNYSFNKVLDSLKYYYAKIKIDTTLTYNIGYLQTKMVNKDVIIFPPHSNVLPFGSLFNSVLKDFISKGGTVIVLGPSHANYNTQDDIYKYDLFKGIYVSQLSYPSQIVTNTGNNLMNGMGPTFPSISNTHVHSILNADKIVAASYNGFDVITYRSIGYGRAEYFGFDFATASVIGHHLLANSIKYANKISFPSWFGVASINDTVAGGDSKTVMLKFNSKNYLPGTYNGYIVVQTNDPLHPTDSVFVTMNVSANLTMNLNKNCFDFDSVQNLATVYDTLKIGNSFCDTLRIDSISFTNSDFSISPVSKIISPGGKAAFVISFNPQSTGNYNEWMHVYTNVIDTLICLNSFSNYSPLMSFAPDLLYGNLTCYDSVVIPLYIHNTNNGPLNFTINNPATSGKHVLVWPAGNMSSTKIVNMLNSVNEHYADYIIDTSTTNQPVLLQSKLLNASILLIPPKTFSGIFPDQQFATTIQNFVGYGGTVIVCGSTGDSSEHRIYRYGLFNGSYSGYSSSTLTVSLPQELLMDSVPASFTSPTYSFYHSILNPDKIAPINNNTVVYRKPGKGKSIYTGFDFTTSNSTAGQIVANAIEFASPFNTWQNFNLSVDTGTVNAGDSMLVYVTIYAINFSPGQHLDSLLIMSNDPIRPAYYLPLILNVNQNGNYNLSDTCLQFSSLHLGETEFKKVVLSNYSCDSMFVTAVNVSDSNFYPVNQTVSVAPGDSSEIIIAFNPKSTGVFVGIVTLLNNLHDTTICISGTSIVAPQFLINSDSLVITLSSCKDTINVPMYILNAGGDTLQFHLDSVNAPVRVLAMTYGVDIVNEFTYMVSGINQYFTNYELDSASLTSPIELQYLLRNKEVLLFPKQETGITITNSNFAPLLQNYVASGGEAIVCGSAYTNNKSRIYEFGLFSGAGYNSITTGSLTKYNSTDPLLTSIGNVYAGVTTHLTTISNPDKVKLLGYSTYDETTYRNIGLGKSLYIGFDFTSINTQHSNILANALKYVPKRTKASWIHFNSTDGNVMSGDSLLINLSFNSSLISNGTYRDTLWFHTNDPIQPLFGYPIVLHATQSPCVAYSHSQQGCSGYVSFFDLSSNTPTSWLWNFGDSTTSNVKSPVHLYADSGYYTVQLIACNSFGCDTLTQVIYVQDVSGPKLANCIPVTQSNCCGNGITNVALNTINNSTADASEGYQDFSCDVSTTLIAGNSYNINVITGTTNPENVKAWIDYNNNINFDVNSETILTSNNVLNNHTSTFVVPLSAVHNIPLRMRVKDDSVAVSVSPCNYPTNGQAEDYAVVIVANSSPPDISFSFNQTDSCEGEIQFTSISQNSPAWYLWYFGDGDSSAVQDPVHTFSSSGNYNVTFIAGNVFGNDTFQLTVYAHVLQAGFGVAGIMQTGQSLQFTPAANNAISYLWNFGNGDTSSLQNPSYIYNSSGVYIVSLTVSDSSCTLITIDTLNIITVGISEIADLKSLQINPNPFTDLVNISYTLSSDKNVTIEVENATGQTVAVLSSNEKQRSGKHSYLFNPVAKGFYILKVTINKMSKSFRMIKM